MDLFLQIASTAILLGWMLYTGQYFWRVLTDGISPSMVELLLWLAFAFLGPLTLIVPLITIWR